MRRLVVLFLAVALAGASNFYIFYKQVGANPNCPGLAIDAANNAPSHRKWTMDAGGNFSEDNTLGDWMIRAAINWTPQDTNAGAVWFATNMPKDTVPNINFAVRAVIRNMGTDTLPVGTPVRLHITGPSSYTYDDTMATIAALSHGQTAQLNFSPAWHIPNVAGVYNIKVWTEAAGDKWPADDTMAYDLSCANWIQYHTDANLHWLTWVGPERAVRFNPADFSVQYPVGISRVRADFYWVSQYPWPDTSFTFKIYGDDGQTLLYESDTLEAIPGTPGAYRAVDLDSMVVIPSGTFYVAVAPVSSTGHPSTCADSGTTDHSYYGSPGAWALWTPGTGLHGNFFISAAVQGNVTLGGGSRRWIGPSENSLPTVAGSAQARQREAGAAAAERWNEVCGNPHLAITDPQPGIFPFSPNLLPGTDTMRYDDNMAASAWCMNTAGGGWGVKFISPAESVTVAGALIYFYSGWPVPGDTWASLRVYADDGANGAPGTQLGAIDSFRITRGAWNYLPILPPSVQEEGRSGLNSLSLRITNSPNPVTDRVTLRWQVPGNTPASIDVYDATGRMVRNLYSATGKATAGSCTLDARTLTAGIYLVRLQTAAGSVTRKIVIDR